LVRTGRISCAVPLPHLEVPARDRRPDAHVRSVDWSAKRRIDFRHRWGVPRDPETISRCPICALKGAGKRQGIECPSIFGSMTRKREGILSCSRFPAPLRGLRRTQWKSHRPRGHISPSHRIAAPSPREASGAPGDLVRARRRAGWPTTSGPVPAEAFRWPDDSSGDSGDREQ
jgi:hypothetical protein